MMGMSALVEFLLFILTIHDPFSDAFTDREAHVEIAATSSATRLTHLANVYTAEYLRQSPFFFHNE